MPYPNETAGFSSISEFERHRVIDAFRGKLSVNNLDERPPLPEFQPFESGTGRDIVVAIDGSNVYTKIPGQLPQTEAGLISIASVIIDLNKFKNLAELPESGAVNPAELRGTESPEVMVKLSLPGRNAHSVDGLSSRDWFRNSIQDVLEKSNFGDESLADTLYALCERDRRIRCPNLDCDENVFTTKSYKDINKCPSCGTLILLADSLRSHEHFSDEFSCERAHTIVRHAFELLCMMNIIRGLAKTIPGRNALGRIAFILDGPLAAFDAVAALQRGILTDLSRIDKLMYPNKLLVMSGIKTGAFVQHFLEMDEAPEPNKRIPNGNYFLPDDNYIQNKIMGRRSDQPWGHITYFGRPLIIKTENGKRLILNLAQPGAAPPLTNQPPPSVINDAIATANMMGIGNHEFLPLRRAHASAAIPLKVGHKMIESLARSK